MTSSVLWTALDAAAATDGTATGDWKATGVSIDSRTVRPGDLFIALQGPSFDGHDYVAEALAKGAAAAMVHRPVTAVAADAPLLMVDDTMEGLTSLGAMARLRMNGLITAVTGSVGKTGTKEALRLALEDQAPTYATLGNLNNQWGVPLSLARMPAETAYGVFELGMNHAGEIEPLSRQVKPHVAIITTVEAVHTEHFSSVEGIADAKAEIFAGMGPASVAVLNRDNPYFARLVAHARTQGIGRIWSFGEHAQADARLVDCSLHATASAVNAVIRGEAIQYSLSAPGRHWVMNSLAVLLAVKALGADLTQAARALAKIAPPKGRGARNRVRLTREGETGAVLVIDESYNASPASMAAAIRVLAKSDLGDRGRRIAVLGDMLELGDEAPALHAALKHDLTAAEVDLVFACGPNMAKLYDVLPPTMRGACTADSAALLPIIAEAVRPGDAVMVKGSLGSRMAPIVEALQTLDESGGVNGNHTRRPKRAASGS
ncbi:MAG TPA: UDP-N-acetylmuramoylalanyl-D-glutamyl-2,6-diaminopimelate--D-alanyl-D-alanine ligase [Alphaproteobacteria bacterium]|nr:UDP-N-acetylmuramoylalanyl-D-glutamyl-2,6-diaminopimelate--D-alanyl-D-alanine ligase [Alphaproteobacteria bacterium]